MSSLIGVALGAATAQPHADAVSRAVYVQSADPEDGPPDVNAVRAIRGHLRRRAAEETDARNVDELVSAIANWGVDETTRFLDLLDRTDSDGGRDALARRATLACAPLALRSGAHLQWMSAPGNADDPVVLRILKLYASDTGVGRPRNSRGSAYLGLLRQLRLAEHAAPTTRLTHDPRIADRDFYLPGLLLAMSRRPDEFRLEILGADLCLRTIGLLPALALVRKVHPDAADWAAINLCDVRDPEAPNGFQQSRDAVDAALAGAADGDPQQVLLGARWTLAAARGWSRSLRAELDQARDPAYEMSELLRLRAREGAVYHQRFQLRGRPLSEWLQDCRTDPRELLDVLAGSKLVKPGRSGSSSLVNGLIGERGPMFRVFAPEDLTVIRRWIDSLPAPTAASTAEPMTAADTTDPVKPVGPGPAEATPPDPSCFEVPVELRGPESPGAPRDAAPHRGAETTGPRSLREAYHLLQRRAAGPAADRFAFDYVQGWLARSRHGMRADPQRLPDTWGPEGLRPWLVEQHDAHGRDFEASSDLPMPSREALIDSTVQLAPLTLIDGAWLQGFTDYEHASSEHGNFLFETYWDELGNGEPRLNHPLIYRQVLAEMDVRLPPTASREFADWPGFRDGSFQLPVYWLSIGRFPRTFLPEVLGLNLAMELSGVGGTYRRARLALKKHGFSTRFVDIHNTIDNVATGHSAWAADAIDTYLASAPETQGAAAQADIWDRVRVGFRSLNPPSGHWARRAFRRGFRHAHGARPPALRPGRSTPSE